MPSRPLTLLGCLLLAAASYSLIPGDERVRTGLALFVLTGSLWISQALHLSLTALLVPLLAALTGALTLRDALGAFAQPVIFLFMGGFALAAALSRHGLDRALAHAMLRATRGRFSLAVAGLFGLTAFLSMWLSNTATTAMMLPLALGLLRADSAQEMSNTEDPAVARTRAFVLLGLAYSASIGGMGTLVGSPPNAIAAAQAGISFMQWLSIGIPLVLVLLPLMAATLYAVLRPPFPAAAAPAAVAQEWDFTWTHERRMTLLIFCLTVAGWVGGEPLGKLVGLKQDMDTLVALAAIGLLGVTGVLEWRDIERQTQWGVLLLFGGGLALSQVMSATGASGFLAQGLMSWVDGAPTWLVLLALVAFVVMLTELVSNTASAALIIPVVMGLAPAWGMSEASVAAAIAVSASCAFMLPVATPPNAIVFGSGMVSQRTMMRCGLALNLVATLTVSLAVSLWR
jgi:solute carrier family 13 (sodium-dependent dicarboxylate transporter), member 2/3/5